MSNRSNDHSSSCAFTFADGRHCRMPRRDPHPHLCVYHARKEAQALAGQQAAEDIAYHLSGAYLTACDLNSALGRLFAAVAQGHIKPKAATTLAYLGQTLVQNMHLAKHEYINAYGTDAWRETVRHSHELSEDHISSREESPVYPACPEPRSEPRRAVTSTATLPSETSASKEKSVAR